LFVYGFRIETLRGVESFRGKFLKIDTGKNKKRNLDLLTEAHVDRQLILTYAKAADIDPPKAFDWSTLAALSGLKGFSLMGKITAPFRLSSLPPMPKLESMALWVNRVDEQDAPHLTSAMPRLQSLKLPAGASSIARAWSGRNPELLVSAGDLNFRAGQRMTAGS
jgi:hypothetical protein